MAEPRFPSLYQVNTRVMLTALSRELGRAATLDDVPDAELDRWQALGFDWIWLLSVWRTGAAGRRISRENPEWRREFAETLPDLREDDIAGSGFAITGYAVDPSLGGNAALARLRARLARRGLRLMLDFVPNHTALDHPWVGEHPAYYVEGSELDLARAPQNYVWVDSGSGPRLFAHGRDPYFPGWPDTLQLDYAHPDTQEAMVGELEQIASLCDGVRCDMAMLVLPDVFERTWGRRPPPFWEGAIERVRKRAPEFRFMAEVYWDLEWTMQQLGFDWAYDKRLYDRLRAGAARPVREHLLAGLDYQSRLARFLENHDEPRAAAVFPHEVHQSAATIALLTRGLRFIHEGQLEGRKVHVSMHLGRRPREPVDEDLQAFYWRLLECMRRPEVRDGEWHLAGVRPAWAGNPTHAQLVVSSWQQGERRVVVAVNYGPTQAQGYVTIRMSGLAGKNFILDDLLSESEYHRSGDELASGGLYLDMPAWGCQVFELRVE